MNVKSKEAIAAVTEDGRLVDIGEEEKVKNYLSFADEAGREIYWHSTSHIMAQAVKRLFPEAKLAIGPAIEEGFYYDFDIPRPLTDEDLEEIEKEMRKIIQEDLPFRRKEVSKEEAQKIFAERGETYKVEILEEIEESKVTLYEQGEFLDLCRGPHVPSTGYIKAFKLLSVSGAYWRGREDNPMLQRIYGISFDSEEKLQEFLKRREEAKRRDHRRLGRELDLFSLHEEGPGFPFFHPRGMVVINALLDLWRREHLKWVIRSKNSYDFRTGSLGTIRPLGTLR